MPEEKHEMKEIPSYITGLNFASIPLNAMAQSAGG
jgi:hypothetical protein